MHLNHPLPRWLPPLGFVLLGFIICVLAPIAFALPVSADAAEALTLSQQLLALFGAQPWIMWVGVALLIFKTLRPLMPATWLAKLPSWLLTALDFLADNWGHSKNAEHADPKAVKARPGRL